MSIVADHVRPSMTTVYLCSHHCFQQFTIVYCGIKAKSLFCAIAYGHVYTQEAVIFSKLQLMNTGYRFRILVYFCISHSLLSGTKTQKQHSGWKQTAKCFFFFFLIFLIMTQRIDKPHPVHRCFKHWHLLLRREGATQDLCSHCELLAAQFCIKLTDCDMSPKGLYIL